MMMWGGLVSGSQAAAGGVANGSAIAPSVSSQPWLISADIDSTPERVKLEM